MVAEAAVVGKPDETTGESICAFVVLKQARPTGEEAKKLALELRNWVAKEIGPIAKPKEIRFGDNLPKTRSGKIMRRLLRVLAKGETITQDVSTLENPAILEQLCAGELAVQGDQEAGAVRHQVADQDVMDLGDLRRLAGGPVHDGDAEQDATEQHGVVHAGADQRFGAVHIHQRIRREYEPDAEHQADDGGRFQDHAVVHLVLLFISGRAPGWGRPNQLRTT
jgi:hypothetical protein